MPKHVLFYSSLKIIITISFDRDRRNEWPLTELSVPEGPQKVNIFLGPLQEGKVTQLLTF